MISEKRIRAKFWKKGKICIQCRSEIQDSQNGLAGCQVKSEKQVSLSVKNATMHEKRTLQNLVEIPNASQGNISCKIQSF